MAHNVNSRDGKTIKCSFLLLVRIRRNPVAPFLGYYEISHCSIIFLLHLQSV